MRSKVLSLLAVVLFTLPVYAAKIRGSRIGANARSAGFFVEAFSDEGRVLYKSVKFDEAGKFVLEFEGKKPLIYWIDNFPVYVKPNDDLEIILPEKTTGVFVLGEVNPSSAAVGQETAHASGSSAARTVAEQDIRVLGKLATDPLLIHKLNAGWATFVKEKKGQQTIAEIDQQFAKASKLIQVSKDQEINAVARFYNAQRYLEAKVQYLRAHPTEKQGKNYFSLLTKLSLNDPAVNTLKSIGLRSLVSNYYMFMKLSQGSDVADENLTDNSSLDKMEYLLKNVNNSRILNEELTQSIIYHLSIRGWNPQLDKIMGKAIGKINGADQKKSLIEAREKYSKVSKNAVAPEFSIPDATGKLVKLSDFKGKVVAIDVWATWCIPCMHSLPYFLQFRDQYKDNKDIVFISISTDNEAAKNKWLAFLKSKNMNGIDLHAGDKSASSFEKAYNITGIPRYILIDKEGKIIEDHAVDAAQPEYKTLIENALKSK